MSISMKNLFILAACALGLMACNTAPYRTTSASVSVYSDGYYDDGYYDRRYRAGYRPYYPYGYRPVIVRPPYVYIRPLQPHRPHNGQPQHGNHQPHRPNRPVVNPDRPNDVDNGRPNRPNRPNRPQSDNGQPDRHCPEGSTRPVCNQG